MTPKLVGAGAKTRMGQEHVCKGGGSDWSSRAITQVYYIHKEMSWSLANTSCWRTPGPRRSTIRKNKISVKWAVLIRRTRPHQHYVTPDSVRILNNGSACKQPFSPFLLYGTKLLGIGNKSQTINMKPVNSFGLWGLTEGRGLVVPCGQILRSYGKEAKSVNGNASFQGTAHLEQSLEAMESSNDEQFNIGSVLTYLDKLGTLGNKHPINGLYKNLSRFEIWIAAYAKLSGNPGSLTRGTDTITIDGSNTHTLKAIQTEILSGKYKWGNIRRVWVPKPGKKEKRPLGIPNFRDRVVQEVIRMLLEAIYEPRFKECSHGFRPERGQHTCIRYIRAWFPGVTWYVEGDIKKCFDTIDHDVLIKLLRRRIKDNKFIELIESGLKSAVIDCGLKQSSELGTPQGGIVSPLLSNVYLHELDRYMQRVASVLHKGKRRKASLEYHRLTNKVYRAKIKGDSETVASLSKQMRQLPSKDSMDPNYSRVRFVRFADDFIIGVIGPKTLAERLKASIANFLRTRLKLELSLEKTHITHNEKRIPFLGFLISTAPKTQVSKARLGTRTIRQRIPPLGVKVYTDMTKVINRLALKGYCDKGGNSKPNWRESLQPPQSYGVERAARLLQGLNSYFKVANDRRACIHRITHIVRNSIAKALAAKYKLGTMAKVYAKAGKDLSKPLQSKLPAVGTTDAGQKVDAIRAGGRLKERLIRLPFTSNSEIKKPDLSHSYSGTGETYRGKDPHTLLYGKTERAHTALKGVCSVCQSHQGVEMHHVTALKDLKKREIAERIMIAINRKQIPLCRSCHLRVHGKQG